jgi:hypothetical protein
MERTKDNLIEMDSNLYENIQINWMDSTGICDCVYFMELVRRLRMSDASKFMTNEASNHNNVSPLSIQSLAWSPLFISAMRGNMKHMS